MMKKTALVVAADNAKLGSLRKNDSRLNDDLEVADVGLIFGYIFLYQLIV